MSNTLSAASDFFARQPFRPASLRVHTLREATTLAELVSLRATELPEKNAYEFHSGGKTTRLSYAELLLAAVTIGNAISERCQPGSRALLMFPPGLEFIESFFACQLANVIAVPVYPVNDRNAERALPRLHSVIRSAEPHVLLTTRKLRPALLRLLAQLPDAHHTSVLAVDECDADPVVSGTHMAFDRRPQASPDDIALIQFTSGSTGHPQGVTLSHRQILSNLDIIQSAYGSDFTSSGVFWLPFYHDMGLIGGVLGTIHVGGSTHFLPPVEFIQQPFRWLELMSETSATISGAPNFAYQECIDRISDEQLQSLDLSHWKLAFCGAEPIRRETLSRFADRFASCGFSREALYCSYGLAEATLMVSGGPLFEERDANSNSSTPSTSCGQPQGATRVQIVAPDSCQVLPNGAEGEIWIASPSVGYGYWKQPESTAETFSAYTAAGEGPFLRSGDLGHITDDSLFVTGRRKDLLIIGGVNHHPHDLERSAMEQSEGVIDRVAAFAVDRSHGEALVIVVELSRRTLRELRAAKKRNTSSSQPLADLRKAIRRRIATGHEVQVDDIVFVRPRTIPLTSSGKIQRRRCRKAYSAQTLRRIVEHRPSDRSI